MTMGTLPVTGNTLFPSGRHSPLPGECLQTCWLPGARPSGGVQRRGQQGVPLPDESRFLGVPSNSCRIPASLSFCGPVAAVSTPESFPVSRSDPGAHLWCCSAKAAASGSFVVFAMDCASRACSPVAWSSEPLSCPLSLNPAGQVEGPRHLQGAGPGVWAGLFAV